jgi:hypothetical protein
MQTSSEQLWWTDLEAVEAALAEVEAERRKMLVKTKKMAADTRYKQKAKAAKAAGKKGKKKAADEESDSDGGMDVDDLDDEEAVASKSKAKAKPSVADKLSRPVLLPLDIRTQKTLQAVARECEDEQAEAEVEVESDKEEAAPMGLLARLLASRGEGQSTFATSADFFNTQMEKAFSPAPQQASIDTDLQPPSGEDPTEPGGEETKGVKRGKAAEEGAVPPSAKKARAEEPGGKAKPKAKGKAKAKS